MFIICLGRDSCLDISIFIYIETKDIAVATLFILSFL